MFSDTSVSLIFMPTYIVSKVDVGIKIGYREIVTDKIWRTSMKSGRETIQTRDGRPIKCLKLEL